MILTWFEGNCFHQQLVNRCRQELLIAGNKVIVIEDGHKHHLKLPYELQCCMHTITEDVCLEITVRSCEEVILLYCCVNDDSFANYGRYQMDDIFTISDCDEAQIVFKRDYLKDYELVVDSVGHSLEIKGFADCAVNGRRISEDRMMWQTGDHVQILDLHMIFFENGVCINRVAKIKLHRYHPGSVESFRISKEQVQHILPGFTRHLQMETMENRIVYHRPIHAERETPWLGAGQTLTMSTAALAIGLMSAYQSYMDGNPWTRMIPYLIFPCVMIISTIAWSWIRWCVQKKKQHKNEAEQLNIYKQELMREKERLRDFVNTYLKDAESYYPYMEKMIGMIYTHEMWQKHPYEERFCIRIGEKKDVLSLTKQNDADSDEKAADIFREYEKQIHMEQALPWIIDLKVHNRIMIMDCQIQQMFLSYLLLQIVMFTDTPLVVFLSVEKLEKASWMRLIPNLMFHHERMLFCDCEDEVEIPEEAVVLILDGRKRDWIQKRNPVIYFQNGQETFLVDEVIDLEKLMWINYRTHQKESFQIRLSDQCSMEIVMQQFQSIQNKEKNDTFGILELFGKETVHDLNIQERWNHNTDFSHLCAHLGKDEHGNEIVLDLNENYDGPHGLVAGMTGSGKSELLMTLILSLAVNYSPRTLQFALIDFKGGGLSEALCQENGLPHIAGVLTNLQEEDMARALVSFRNECIRRQSLIAKMNGIVHHPIRNLEEYCDAWTIECGLPRLASLIIIVDEFAELKMEQPDFLHDLISIARIGRSLGVHLILSTQRPAGVVNDEIRANCSFILCLKVAQRQDSFEVLHCEDAYGLKNAGEFILHSERQRCCGKSAYANMRKAKSQGFVKILDHRGNVMMDSDALYEKGVSQVIQILDEIKDASRGFEPVYSLWLGMPEEMKQTGSYPAFMFGKADDYYQRRHCALKLDEGGYAALVIGKNKQQKKQLFQTMLYAVCQGYSNRDEIYVIDDLFFTYQQLDCAMLIDVLNADQDEKIDNLLQHLLMHQPDTNRITVMISDLARFLNDDEKRYEGFRRLMSEADHLQIRMIVFASGMHQIHYRELSSVSHRYALADISLSEMQQLFETGEKIRQNSSYFGLCQNGGHVLGFCCIRTEEDDLKQLMNDLNIRYGTQKPYVLPYMMKERNGMSAVQKGIPIGISYEDYQWVTLGKNEMMYVVSLDRYEFQSYFGCMRKYCMCSQLADYKPEETHLLFLTLDEYRSIRKEDIPVLYIGEGYGEQYTFRSSEKSLSEGEGILFYHRKGRKIGLTNV